MQCWFLEISLLLWLMAVSEAVIILVVRLGGNLLESIDFDDSVV